MSKTAKKVFKITENIGAACAGLVGDMQVLTKTAGAYVSLHSYERERPTSVRSAAKIMSNTLFERRYFPIMSQTIVAGVDEEGPHLFVLDPIGSVIEDRYASVGSGAEIATGVLEGEYKEGMSIDDGMKIIVKAAKSAGARDVGSGNVLDVLIITKDNTKEETITLA
jgi:proteasome beta subunit